jgi:hypothetical protein
MYQSETWYWVFGSTAIGAVIHFASPLVNLVMAMVRLLAPSLPPVAHAEVTVFVPQLLKVQLAGLPVLPASAVSADGLATRLVSAAKAPGACSNNAEDASRPSAAIIGTRFRILFPFERRHRRDVGGPTIPV